MYPVTIIKDRYGGVYSGAEWTAWNRDASELPLGPDAGDVECQDFWGTAHEYPIGRGATPDLAFADLVEQVESASRAKPKSRK